MKRQIIVIHGGDTFGNYEEYLKFLKEREIDFEDLRAGKKDWKAWLPATLGDEYEVIAPQMPNKQNAKYLEWKIWFEKLVSYLEPEIILIGHSMGGIFLAKYLTENDFAKKIKGLFLVAAPYGDSAEIDLADFILPTDISELPGKVEKIVLYHSKDDKVVPFSDFEKYRKALPGAAAKIFDNRGHFNQAEFPELLEDTKSL